MPRLLLALSFVLGVAAAETPFNAPQYGPAPAAQFHASVGSDGRDFLVVWHDQRSRPSESYAARVSRDGTLLDPTGIRLAVTNVDAAKIVWTGSSYLVLWWRARDFAIVGARIGGDGVLLEAPRTLIPDAQLPSVTRAGNRTVIGYLGGKSSPQMPRARFLDESGGVIADVPLAGGATDRGAPRIAWNGSQLVAVWTAGGTIDPAIRLEGVRFNESGAIDAEPRTLLATGYSVMPEIASDGRDFMVVYRDYDTDSHRVLRVGADLGTGTPSALGTRGYDTPSLMWTGSHYVAVTEAAVYRIGAIRVDREGKPLDAEPVVVANVAPAGTAPAPAAATNGTDLLVAWSAPAAGRSVDYDVQAAVVSGSTLAPRAEELLSIAARRESHPVIASSGRNLLTVWSEPGGVYARRAGIDGAPIDATPLHLATGAVATAAVFNGIDYIVAILSSPGAPMRLTTLRIPAGGALRVAGQSSRQIEYGVSVALAHRSGTTLLAWQANDRIEAVRVAADASSIDSAPLLIARGLVGDVDVTAGADSFLVTWGEHEEICCHGSVIPVSVRGARITRGLTTLDPAGFPIAASDALEGDASATWNGREWFVVWTRERGGASEIRARRVASNGSLLDTTASDAGVLLATNAALPQVVWDGARYVVAWFDRLLPDVFTPMRVARFTDAGDRSDARILGEAEMFAMSGPIALEPVAPGRVVVAYARIAREPLYGGVARAFLTTLDAASARRRAARS